MTGRDFRTLNEAFDIFDKATILINGTLFHMRKGKRRTYSVDGNRTTQAEFRTLLAAAIKSEEPSK